MGLLPSSWTGCLRSSAATSGPNPQCYRTNSYGSSGCWKYRVTHLLGDHDTSKSDLQQTRANYGSTGVHVINNRAQVLIQGEGFPRANKHPVWSTLDYMAAGSTSALMTLGSFEKQSAQERQDQCDNRNHHYQQACLIMRSSNQVSQESGDWSLERKRMAEMANAQKEVLTVPLNKWHKQGHSLWSCIWMQSAREASTRDYKPDHVIILLVRQFTQLQWMDSGF